MCVLRLWSCSSVFRAHVRYLHFIASDVAHTLSLCLEPCHWQVALFQLKVGQTGEGVVVGGGGLFTFLLRNFCFVKFPVSPGLFPSGFIHDPHLEIIYIHKNKPSAAFGKTLVCVCVCSRCVKGPLGPQVHRRSDGQTLKPGSHRAALKQNPPPKKSPCCLRGLTPVFDSNAESVSQRTKPQLLGEITSQADPWQKRLTLAQLRNMR